MSVDRQREAFAVRWGRRALSVPATLLMALLLAGLAPLALPFSLFADVLRPRRLGLTRTALFLLAFVWCEALGIVAAFAIWVLSGRLFGIDHARFLAANARLQAVWGKLLFSTAAWLFQLRLVVEGDAPAPGRAPLLVFVRHSSTVDTVLPIVLLSYPLGWRLRYVMKRELLADPCLDIVGNRLPNYFVRRRGERTAGEVERVTALLDGMDAGDAFVIFPEGTRFTPKKRLASIARLAARGSSSAASLAEELTHTLSPLRRGPLAVLAKNPGADLLVIAHAGLEAAVSLASFTSGTLVRATLRVRLRHVPFAHIPADADGRARLLADLWREVDRFAADPTHENAAAPAAARAL